MIETVLTGDTPAVTGDAPAKKRRTRKTAGEDQGKEKRSGRTRSPVTPADTSEIGAGSTTARATEPVRRSRSRSGRAPAPVSEGSASVLEPGAGEGDSPPPPIGDEATAPEPSSAPGMPAPGACTDAAGVAPMVSEGSVNPPEPLEEVGPSNIDVAGAEETAASGSGDGSTEAEPQAPAAPVSATTRFRVGQARPARPTFKETVLREAEERFRGDPVREPLTERQVDDLLVLLHQRGQNRSLVDATYDYLRRGMSKAHAKTQIEKLRGTYVPRETGSRLPDARMAA